MPEQPALKSESKAKLMRIYVGENDKWNGKPLYEAIVGGLRAHDIAASPFIAASWIWRESQNPQGCRARPLT